MKLAWLADTLQFIVLVADDLSLSMFNMLGLEIRVKK